MELHIGVGPDDFPLTLWRKWRLLAHSKGISDVDLLSTFTELPAPQIAIACAKFGWKHVADGKTDVVLLRGGVCDNSYFVERFRANLEVKLLLTGLRLWKTSGLTGRAGKNAMYAMFGYFCYRMTMYVSLFLVV